MTGPSGTSTVDSTIAAMVAFSFRRPQIPDALLPRLAALSPSSVPMDEAIEMLRALTPDGSEYMSDAIHDELAIITATHIQALRPLQVYLQWEVAIAMYRLRPNLFDSTAIPVSVLWPTDLGSPRFSSYHVAAHVLSHDRAHGLDMAQNHNQVALVAHAHMAKRARRILTLAGYDTTMLLTTEGYTDMNVQPHIRTPFVYGIYDMLARVHVEIMGKRHLASAAPTIAPRKRVTR